jgi:hypothetical protein
MGLSLWNLYEAGLLIVNAIAVLHEERFLSKIGWGRNQWQQQQQYQGFGGPSSFNPAIDQGLKANLLNMIHSIRTVMRIPLILLNIVTIVFKLILG